MFLCFTENIVCCKHCVLFPPFSLTYVSVFSVSMETEDFYNLYVDSPPPPLPCNPLFMLHLSFVLQTAKLYQLALVNYCSM